MKKAVLSLCLLTIFLLTSQIAVAKMSIISPQRMIDISDYIIVGKIRSNVVTENPQNQFTVIHREVTVTVEEVLKGVIVQKEIVLKRNTRKDKLLPGEVSYDFPKNGTRVMLLLRNNPEGLALTYVNCVCVIKKNGKLELYHGMGLGITPKAYEQNYQAFYDSATHK